MKTNAAAAAVVADSFCDSIEGGKKHTPHAFLSLSPPQATSLESRGARVAAAVERITRSQSNGPTDERRRRREVKGRARLRSRDALTHISCRRLLPLASCFPLTLSPSPFALHPSPSTSSLEGRPERGSSCGICFRACDCRQAD